MILLSHPTGNEFVRAALEAFDRAGMLGEFWTTLSWNSKSPMNRLTPRRLREILQRRSFPETIRTRTRTIPQREMIRLFAGAVGITSKHETGAFSIDAVIRELDRKVAERLREIGPPEVLDSVYAYEDGALKTFRAARDRGFKRIYDLPIAYWQTSRPLLREEAERYPDWEPTLGATRDSDEKLSRKTQELELAQLVVCPSKFVLESLPPEVRAQKQCLIAPFGSPDVDLRNDATRSSGRLRVLFAGALTQRKGLADLFAAMKLVSSKQIELVVMGSLLRPLSWYRERFADFVYEQPRPHGEVLRLMQSCDVFILPSIVEGRALVQQEAMACGLPVIATKNAGADDLIVDGEAGFLIPIRSPEAIAEKLSWCAANRSLVDGMGIAARKRAAEFTWRAYGESIVAAVRAPTWQ
ncbi:MAG TPA: glycosyltransferase family 4 protein [Chthoniobacterales bacterium]|nr:glycosyltransferase family 4 protein [Chthoniobacterales bacterium]